MESKGRIRNIKELADLAGVSPGTVSRALTDTGLISQKTRERIKALAREHDFRPNLMARNLRIRRTGAIGVAIPLGHETGQHVSDPFFITLLGHLADSLTERGYDLVLSRVIPRDDEWVDKIVDSGRVDGLLVIGQSDQAATLDRVAARYLPLAVWGGYEAGQVHCSVGSDNHLGGMLATRHLLAQGCRRIAFFGDPRAREIAQRLGGCRAALAEAGLGSDPEVVPSHLVADAAYPDIATFFSRTAQRPDGIVAASDVIAMTVLRALSEQGIAVPGDIRVVGYDDLSFADHMVPRLTTIRQDLVAGAAHMVDLLFRRLGGERTDSVVMKPELVVRHSA